MVMIGIDPHKRTHTAVAVDDHEVVLSELLVHTARAKRANWSRGLTGDVPGRGVSG